MANQTSEQMKSANTAAMGEPLGAQYSELWQELAHVHIRWAEFVDLFCTKKERVDLLNRAASLHFRTTQDALWESTILHLARITDRSQTFGKSNLTIQNLPALITDEGLKSKVTQLVASALEASEFCLEWRHQVFAHHDLDIALKNPAKPVPTANREQVDAALKAIADVLNAIGRHYKIGETGFEHTPRSHGAVTLLGVLDEGMQAHDRELARLEKLIGSEEAPPPTSAVSTTASPARAKLKARVPRGLADRGPGDIAATRQMTDAIRAVYERYGFEPVETPAIEYTDALGKFLPDQDRPNEGVFSFQDDDEQWLSLRYDLTAPLARYVAENFQKLALPYRSYRFGWVFRNEKPGPGRFRQFMQFDADTVGGASMAADAEICMMAADTMEELGIQRGQYVVKVNNRKVLDGILDASRVPLEKRLIVLRAIDKWDRLGPDGVKLLLGSGRRDESGDFTSGADLDSAQIDPIVSYLSVKAAVGSTQSQSPQVGSKARIDDWAHLVGQSPSGQQGISELREIASLVAASGYGDDRIVCDSSVVRGLEYYTGPVYEVELLLETKDEKGRPVRFGSVGGGGRYDGLVSRFRGEPVPATGFSIGVSRLQAALTMIGRLDSKPAPGPVLVTVFDRDRVADYQKMVAALRNAGIRAELYLGNPKNNVGQQLKYADRRGSPCAVIQGGDEKARNEVQIKDLILGAGLTAIKDRDEYLKKQAEAQFAASVDKLVDAVRQVLARHGVSWI
jgi:histidyl-tRNA synthetase